MKKRPAKSRKKRLLSLVAMNGIQLVLIGKFMQAYLAQFPPRVEGERRIILHNGEGYYARDIIQNDPWLRGKEIVFLVKSDAEKEKIMSHFPAASWRAIMAMAPLWLNQQPSNKQRKGFWEASA